MIPSRSAWTTRMSRPATRKIMIPSPPRGQIAASASQGPSTWRTPKVITNKSVYKPGPQADHLRTAAPQKAGTEGGGGNLGGGHRKRLRPKEAADSVKHAPRTKEGKPIW